MDSLCMRHLFDAAYLGLISATLPFWLYKAATTGKYRAGLAEKFLGAEPKPMTDRPVVWFHAVSVGEVLLLKPLLQQLRSKRSDLEVVLSTTTSTGYAVAKERYPDLTVFYAPLDFSWAVGRVFDSLQPSLLVLVELELWPNMLLEAKQREIPVVVVNARLSERSYRGYSKVKRLLAPALSAIRCWVAQSKDYADRIESLTDHHPPEITIAGSMKYDGALTDRDNPQTAVFRKLLGYSTSEKILIAGSTQEYEESVVLDAFRSLRDDHPELRLIIVPRHKERFHAVARMLADRGETFVQRSMIQQPLPQSAPVTLVDSIGELGAIWGLADYAYVGGSMNAGRGGQSMIEPAAFGAAVCFGPEIWNFKDTVDRLIAAEAAVLVQTATELLPTLRGWLDHPEAAEQLGRNARRFILAQQGSVATTLAVLERWLPSASLSRKIA